MLEPDPDPVFSLRGSGSNEKKIGSSSLPLFQESGEDEKVEFITSFGGADSDTENKNGGFTFR